LSFLFLLYRLRRTIVFRSVPAPPRFGARAARCSRSVVWRHRCLRGFPGGLCPPLLRRGGPFSVRPSGPSLCRPGFGSLPFLVLFCSRRLAVVGGCSTRTTRRLGSGIVFRPGPVGPRSCSRRWWVGPVNRWAAARAGRARRQMWSRLRFVRCVLAT
jgi:hypothetical protein